MAALASLIALLALHAVLKIVLEHRAGVPNPTFAMLCSSLRAKFGFAKDTGKPMMLVSFLDQKLARWTRRSDGANF